MSLVHQHEMCSKFCSYKVHKSIKFGRKDAAKQDRRVGYPLLRTSWRRLQVSQSWNQSTERESTHSNCTGATTAVIVARCQNCSKLCLLIGPFEPRSLQQRRLHKNYNFGTAMNYHCRGKHIVCK